MDSRSNSPMEADQAMDAKGDNEQECVGELVNWMLLNSRSGYPLSRSKIVDYFSSSKRGRGFSINRLLRKTEDALSDIFGFQIETACAKPDTLEETPGALKVATERRKKRTRQFVHFNLVYLPETEVDEEEVRVVNKRAYAKTDEFSTRRQAERSFLVLILIAIFLGGGRLDEEELKTMMQNSCEVRWTDTQHPVLGDIPALLTKLVKQKMLYKQKVDGAHAGEETSYLWHSGTRANIYYPKSVLYKAYKEMLGDQVSPNDGAYKRLLKVEKKGALVGLETSNELDRFNNDNK